MIGLAWNESSSDPISQNLGVRAICNMFVHVLVLRLYSLFPPLSNRKQAKNTDEVPHLVIIRKVTLGPRALIWIVLIL